MYVFVTYFFKFLMVSWGHRGRVQFLVELHVDGMQFYQQWNLLRLHRTAFCGECSSSKSDGEPLLLLEMNFTIDIKYFTSSFHHTFMLQ